MRLPKMPKGDGGFTLVELLVVILIIVILSVSMLPLLKPYIVKAQYAAEAVPLMANIRTKIELYRFEKNHLPGLALTDDIKAAVKGVEPVVSTLTSANEGTALIQVLTEDGEPAEKGYSVSTVGLPAYGTPGVADDKEDHVFTQIEVAFTDVTGRRLRPQYVQYLVAGVQGSAYQWAIGVFGSKDGLPLGTGYAIMEFSDPKQDRRFVALFEQYKEDEDVQINFAGPALGYMDDPVLNETKKKYCWIPDFAQLTGDQNTFEGALNQMREAGWNIN